MKQEFKEMPMFNQALINEQKVVYDALSPKTLAEAKAFYKEDTWTYIGSSNTTYHNGVENVWPYDMHFFIRKY